MINNRYFLNSFFTDHLIQRKGSWLWGIVSDIKTVFIHQEVVDIHYGYAFFCLICRRRCADNHNLRETVFYFQ